MPDVRILGIPGSLRRASFNRMALEAAQWMLPEGDTLEIFGLKDIPPYNQDLEKQPPSRVIELKTRVRAADAILFSTPEYNYSVPGVLKNVRVPQHVSGESARGLIANASQRFNERGELTDETSRELIRKLLAELVAWTRRLGRA